MNNEQNTNIQYVSGNNIPDDAIPYKNCGCGLTGHDHLHIPEKIGTFDNKTNTFSVISTNIL